MTPPGTQMFAGTKSGVARVENIGGGAYQIDLGIQGSDVHCVAVDPGDPQLVLAGTWDDGVFRSCDGGLTWKPAGEGITERRVLSLAVSRADATRPVVYVGTEPANLYRSEDGGVSWRRLDGLHAVPSAPRWYYPPRRGGQRVRSIVPAADDPSELFVGIEVGGVMCSRDGGETWEDHRRHCFEDSHALATHPLAPERIYQGAAGGVALSVDAGRSWRHLDTGIRRRFVWALAVDAADPGLWYVSAAYSPGDAHRGDGSANAAIYRNRGDGRWRAPAAADGMAEMPLALITLRERPGAVVAGCDSGRLLLSEDAGESWTDLGVALPKIRALAQAAA